MEQQKYQPYRTNLCPKIFAPKFSVRTLTVHRLACTVWDSDPRLPMPDKTPAIGKAVKWNNCRIIGTKIPILMLQHMKSFQKTYCSKPFTIKKGTEH